MSLSLPRFHDSSAPGQRTIIQLLICMMAHIPSAQNLSNSYQRTTLAELSSLFVDRDLSVIQAILRHLAHMQIKAGGQHKFHLILESQVNDTRDAPLPSSYFLYQRPANVSTRVLFSPTLSPSVTCGFERSRVETLIRSLNEISYHAMPPTQFHPSQQAAVEQNRQGMSLSTPFTGAQNRISSEEEELRVIGTIRIPTWFPFLGTEYTKPPQFSEERLSIDPAVAGRFSALKNDDISLLYRVFFEFLHRHARKRSDRYKQNMLKYSMFTPPWLRRQFAVRSAVVLMPKVVLPDQRENRNKMGYKRMALILSGFYMNEPYFGKLVLEYLCARLPDIKREAERRRQVRHAPLTSAANTRSEKRLRPPKKFTRQVKVRGQKTLPEAAGPDQETTDEARTATKIPHRDGDRRNHYRTGEINRGKLRSYETARKSSSGTPASVPVRAQQSRSVPLIERKQVAKPTKDRASSGNPSSHSSGCVRISDESDTIALSLAITATHTEDSGQSEVTTDNVQKSQDHERAPITCGAGSSCMFINDSNSQDVGAITGRCSKCDRPLHDLCGGGEEGDMLCFNCAQ